MNANSGFFPAANIVAYDDRYEIALALPGYKKEDVQITFEDYLLKVSSEKKGNTENAEYRHREFMIRPFSRHYRLPDTIDGENLEAVLDRGILTVVLNKKEEAVPKPPRQINIH